MDEFLKALTETVRTGNALASPALYLFFAYKIITPFAVTTTVVGTVWVICKTTLKHKELDRGK